MLELKNVSYSAGEDDGGVKDILTRRQPHASNERFVAVTGPNGGGKSTLAKLIAGIDKAHRGPHPASTARTSPTSASPSAPSCGISYAFQQPVRFKGITVLRPAAAGLGPEAHRGRGLRRTSAAVGLCARDYVNREVNASLSGGELKRIEIATMLARGTQLSHLRRAGGGHRPLELHRTSSQCSRRCTSTINGSILIISHQERILEMADKIVVHRRPASITAAAARREEILPVLMKPSRRRCGRLEASLREANSMDKIQQTLLEQVADLHGVPEGAYNIRADGAHARRAPRRRTSDIVTKTDKPGIDIYIKPGTKNESVHIPVIIAKTGLKEVVYNDFYIGEDCDVTIVAGCGISQLRRRRTVQHDGIHSFFVGKNAKVKYVERHYAEGDGRGERIMNPMTIVDLDEGAYMEMDTTQIKGVDSTKRADARRSWATARR